MAKETLVSHMRQELIDLRGPVSVCLLNGGISFLTPQNCYSCWSKICISLSEIAAGETSTKSTLFGIFGTIVLFSNIECKAGIFRQ